jgi:hypothetical protein
VTRRRLPPKTQGRGPFAIAGFVAIPLFFSALMASTLAQEKPYVIQWKGCKNGICTTWHEPTSATEARVWLWALVPPLALVLVGWICTRVPYGWYVACTVAIVEAMAVVHKVGTWEAHHVSRFPWGVDLIPGTNFQSNQYDPGEWEKNARDTAISLQHWTIVLAAAAIVVSAGLASKRRWFARAGYPDVEPPPVESVHAPTMTTIE